MKRVTTLLIILLAAVIFAAVGWYLFVRDENIPLGDAVRDVLPFGSGEDLNIPGLVRDNLPTTPSDQPTTTDQLASPVSKLFRISETPVAGAVIFKRGTQTIARYAERATGHIYDVVLPTNASSTKLDKTRITNNTIPKIYEAHFRADGAAVLYRSLENDTDVVENLSLALTPPVANSRATSSEFYTVSANALRGDIGSVSVGSSNNLFYSLKSPSSIVASAFNGTSPRTLTTSAFTDWRLVSAGNTLITYTKASAANEGYAYAVNTSSGGMSKILGPLYGLVVVPNTTGNRVAYSHLENGGMRLVIKNMQSNTTATTSLNTIAEKCVWGNKAVFTIFCAIPMDWNPSVEPDAWYKGSTQFSDRIWLYDTEEDIAQVIGEPKSSVGVDIDVINPKISPDEDYLVFNNKNDLSLWALRLK